MQWACDGVPCECEFGQRASLRAFGGGGGGVAVRAALRSHRTDAFTPEPKDQELPAVYVAGEYDRLVTYDGPAPWTGAGPRELPTPQPQPPWRPGRFNATEGWAAFVNSTGWGLCVVASAAGLRGGGFEGPGSKRAGDGAGGDEPGPLEWLGGFTERPGAGRSSVDPTTGYLAPVRRAALGPDAAFGYDFALVLGTVAEIRAAAAELQGRGGVYFSGSTP